MQNNNKLTGGVMEMANTIGREPRYYLAVRNGRANEPTYTESANRILSGIEDFEPLDKDGFISACHETVNVADSGVAAVILEYAAACYMKPHMETANIPLHNFMAADPDKIGRLSDKYAAFLASLFAEKRLWHADEMTSAKFKYLLSSSDFAPLIINGYDGKKGGVKKAYVCVGGMRSVFNGLSASIGTGNLDLINYHITAPGALFCTNPPRDKGLRWRSILVKLPEFLPGLSQPQDAEDKVLSADAAGRLGAALLETAKGIDSAGIKAFHKSVSGGISETIDFEGRLHIADLSLGILLLSQTAKRLGTSFEEAFGCDEDAAVLKAAQTVELSDLV